MRIMILGGDGYCGWPTSLYLSDRGHDIAILDSLIRRHWDEELGTESLTPILDLRSRLSAWQGLSGRQIEWFEGSVTDYLFLRDAILRFAPDAVVHFAEQRSAPYSMIDRDHAALTQTNNVIGTLNLLFALSEVAPKCHLIKLGTMGEYGQPNIPIEEGFIQIVHEGRQDVLPFPMQPGSFYHLSKVHDSQNIMFACKIWGLRATDLHQGVVYGAATEQTRAAAWLVNRFDYDAVFGTALNRFCVEAAIGFPLTVYGSGTQTRGFIDIRDTVRCIELAALSPPSAGMYRVMNQFTEQFRLTELAAKVREAAAELGIPVEVGHLCNPRVEKENHFYQAKHTKLMELGLEPHLLSNQTLAELINAALGNRGRVRMDTLVPRVRWAPGRGDSTDGTRAHD